MGVVSKLSCFQSLSVVWFTKATSYDQNIADFYKSLLV